MRNSLRFATHRRFTGVVVFLCLLTSSIGAQERIRHWGSYDWGLEANTPVGAEFIQIAAGYEHSVALRADGSLVAWGFDDDGQVSNTPPGTDFIQVSAGRDHSLALRADGSIAAWGSGYLVANTPTGTGFIQVESGQTYSLALRADGSIEGWGVGSVAVFHIPAETGFTQVSAGRSHGLALRSDGSIAAWGWNSQGQLDAPSGTGFVRVAAGGDHSLALRSDGSIVAWGWDVYNQVSDTPTGSGFTWIEACAGGFSLALRKGLVVAWGRNNWGQVTDVPYGAGFNQVVGGFGHCLASRPDAGGAFCSGDGSATTCPCGAFGNADEGCANSQGSGGAQLVGFGQASLSDDSFGLFASGMGPNKPGLILRGSTQTNWGLGNPVGDGLLCTSGQTARSQVQNAGWSTGSTTFLDFQGLPFGLSSYGAEVPTNYQLWYRDTANTCTGANFNFSNAWTVTWAP